MPRKAKKGIYKQKEFQAYLLWKSLPAYISNFDAESLKSSGYTDPLLLEIIGIKTQSEFAKHFNIKDLGTLTDWNKHIDTAEPLLFTNQLNFFKQKQKLFENEIWPHIQKLETEIQFLENTLRTLELENRRLKHELDITQHHAQPPTTKFSKPPIITQVDKSAGKILNKIKNILLK